MKSYDHKQSGWSYFRGRHFCPVWSVLFVKNVHYFTQQICKVISDNFKTLLYSFVDINNDSLDFDH